MNGKEEVWDKVEAFRREHLVGSLQHLPVDVFSLTDAELPHWHSYEGVRSAFADSVAPKFGVNVQVIEVRLDREGIWLAT
jgi:hypothetical protein